MTLARLRSFGLFSGLVFAALVVGHHLIYFLAHGEAHDHARAVSAAGHDGHWAILLIAVGCAAVGIMALAVHQLHRLAKLADSTPSGAVVRDADVGHLVEKWLSLFAKVAAATTVAYLVQENVELASIGAGLPGLGVITGEQAIAIPALLVVAGIVALAGALVRWRRDVLLARIQRGSRPQQPAAQLWSVAHLTPLVSADGGGSNGTRAPPLAGAAVP